MIYLSLDKLAHIQFLLIYPFKEATEDIKPHTKLLPKQHENLRGKLHMRPMKIQAAIIYKQSERMSGERNFADNLTYLKTFKSRLITFYVCPSAHNISNLKKIQEQWKIFFYY